MSYKIQCFYANAMDKWVNLCSHTYWIVAILTKLPVTAANTYTYMCTCNNIPLTAQHTFILENIPKCEVNNIKYKMHLLDSPGTYQSIYAIINKTVCYYIHSLFDTTQGSPSRLADYTALVSLIWRFKVFLTQPWQSHSTGRVSCLGISLFEIL